MYPFNVCPFNENHRFAEQRYSSHINRCKDGKKLQHLFTICKYHNLHILRKQDIEAHHLICCDRQASSRFITELSNVYANCCKNDGMNVVKKEVIKIEECLEGGDERDQQRTLSVDQIKRQIVGWSEQEDGGTKMEEEEEVEAKVEVKVEPAVYNMCDNGQNQPCETTAQQCSQCMTILNQITVRTVQVKESHRRQLEKLLKAYRKLI